MTAQPTLVDNIAEAERMQEALASANAKVTEALRDRSLPDANQRYLRAYDILVGALDDQRQSLRVLIKHMEESAPVASIAMAPAPRYQIRRVDHGYMVVDTSLQPGLNEFGTFEGKGDALRRMDDLNRAAERGRELGAGPAPAKPEYPYAAEDDGHGKWNVVFDNGSHRRIREVGFLSFAAAQSRADQLNRFVVWGWKPAENER